LVVVAAVVRVFAAALILVACNETQGASSSSPSTSSTSSTLSSPKIAPAGGIRTIEAFHGKAHDLQRWLTSAFRGSVDNCSDAADRVNQVIDKHLDLVVSLHAFRAANKQALHDAYAKSDHKLSPTEGKLMPALGEVVGKCADDPAFEDAMTRLESL
jgi:hypothetical protein